MKTEEPSLGDIPDGSISHNSVLILYEKSEENTMETPKT